MASALNMKFKAVQKKVDQSAKARPWKRPVVFMVALAWMLLLAIFEMLKAFFEEDKDTPPVEEIDARAADAEALMDETLFLHNHYEMNGTIVQGLKNSE